jgi:2-haloacid dehalogenase
MIEALCHTRAMNERFTEVQALFFDVFGSVVDWRGSLIADIGAQQIPGLDVERLVDDWRGAYGPSMQRVREGQLPWTNLDELHRTTLEALLAEQGIKPLGGQALDRLNTGWHRLHPWPDSVAGLTALKTAGYQIMPLSNGNRELLTDLAEFAGLPWTRIFSAEDFKHYKPDPAVYLGALNALELEPAQGMMCAAHNYDLKAAQSLGMRTAFWPRPTEYGPRQTKDFAPTGPWDIVARDIGDLAVGMT